MKKIKIKEIYLEKFDERGRYSLIIVDESGNEYAGSADNTEEFGNTLDIEYIKLPSISNF